MTLRRPLLLFATSGMVAACGDVITSPDLFPSAIARRTCGPTDGPAVSILLARDSVTTLGEQRLALNLTLWRGVGDLPGRRLLLAQDSNDGFASLTSVPVGLSSLWVPLTGRVDIRRVTSDTSIVGFVDITFPDGERFARTFTARWQSAPTFCG
jgi:hypothetical protein